MVVELSEQQFCSFIKEHEFSVVHFYEEACISCLMMEPLIEDFSERFPSASFARVNIDDCPTIARKHSITLLPHTMIFISGEVKDALPGTLNEDDLEAWLNVQLQSNSL